MTYNVTLTKKASKALDKLDPPVARMITGWLRKNLDGCADPRALGKSLKGRLSDYWSYRIGNYRAIAKIDDWVVVVLVLNIGHRGEVYG